MESAFERTITLQDVLKKIDAGEFCDLEFVKADRKRGTAGALGSMERCVKSTKEDAPKPATTGADKSTEAKAATSSKDPRHYYNATRNMYSPAKREMRKIHIRLITKFNGIRVV